MESRWLLGVRIEPRIEMVPSRTQVARHTLGPSLRCLTERRPTATVRPSRRRSSPGRVANRPLLQPDQGVGTRDIIPPGRRACREFPPRPPSAAGTFEPENAGLEGQYFLQAK